MQYTHHIGLNFLCVLKIVLPIVKRMALQKIHGRVVLIGDPLTSHYNVPGMSPYACSKAALEEVAYNMKSELKTHDIKVHYFLPPPMDSNLFAG